MALFFVVVDWGGSQADGLLKSSEKSSSHLTVLKGSGKGCSHLTVLKGCEKGD